MKKTIITLLVPLVAGLALLTGCLTKQVVTPGTNGGASTTNTVVNTAQLTIDCAVVQINMAVGVSVAVQKDPAIVPVLKDISQSLTGVLNGASTNSAAQVLTLLGENTNPVIVANIGPVVQQASALEQQLLVKYGQGVAGQITIALVTAANSGLTAGLAGK